jgi:hypothetical protein
MLPGLRMVKLPAVGPAGRPAAPVPSRSTPPAMPHTVSTASAGKPRSISAPTTAALRVPSPAGTQ